MNFGYDAYVQSYPDTMHISSIQAPHVDSSNPSPLEMYITPMVGGHNIMVEPEDDDNPDGDENVPHENSIQVARKVLKMMMKRLRLVMPIMNM